LINTKLYKLTLIFIVLFFWTNNSYAQNDSIAVSTNVDTNLVVRHLDTINFNPIMDSSFVNSKIDSVSINNSNIELNNSFTNYFVKLFFKTDSIKLLKNEIVSNVLTIVNISSSELNFKITQIFPAAWELIAIFDEDTYLKLAPNDSLFIPIILIPSKSYRQGSSVIINSVLEDSLGDNIGSHQFSIYSKKNISWNTEVQPGKKVYLKNNKNSANIKYNIVNTGSYEQDFFIKLSTLGNELMITDTLDGMIEQNTTISLNSSQDTSLFYRLTAYNNGQRNYKRISTLNYIPNYKYNDQRYSMFIESSDPKELSGFNKKREKINFIKLPNETIASNESNSSLPLVVDASVQNILGDNVFTTVSMRGFKTLNKEASLSYFSQLNYSSVFWNKELLLNSPWYVGYFDKKIVAEIGQVSGNVSGISTAGKGVKASYQFNSNHNTGAFYVRGPKLFSTTEREAFGISHKYRINDNIRIKGALGRSVNYQQGSFIDAANLYSNFRIAKRHYLSLFLAGTQTRKQYLGQEYNFSGYLIGLNYGTSFFKSRLKTNVSAKYNDRYFSSGSFERFQLNQTSKFLINKKWNVSLNNFYFDINTFNVFSDTVLYKQKQLNNTLLFTTSNQLGSFQPGVFYNYTDIYKNRIHSRGVIFRYSKSNYSRNSLMSSYFRAGYNHALDYENLKNYFIFESSLLVRYKVWSLNARYNYGSISKVSLDHLIQYNKTPQTIRFNLQNQYQFKNKHFVIENSATFFYNNLFDNYSFGYFPQLFFFSNTGWRFGINVSYIYSSNDFGTLYNSNINLAVQEQKSQTHNLNFGFTVRKKFNVPIPFIKSKAVDVEFVSFYDLNGNYIKDENEPAIENVIINIDKKTELITDQNGTGKVNNIELGKHSIDLIRLDGVKGWFSNVQDSVDISSKGICFLPFVRGVKVYGEVVVSRQKIAIADNSKKFDLSRIKITATNENVYSTLTDVNGKFEFYLPNGEYTISMDEKVLGTKFKMSSNNIIVNLRYSHNNSYVSFYVSENKRKVTIKEF